MGSKHKESQLRSNTNIKVMQPKSILQSKVKCCLFGVILMLPTKFSHLHTDIHIHRQMCHTHIYMLIGNSSTSEETDGLKVFFKSSLCNDLILFLNFGQSFTASMTLSFIDSFIPKHSYAYVSLNFTSSSFCFLILRIFFFLFRVIVHFRL